MSNSGVMAVEPVLLGAVETDALLLPSSVESELSTLCVSADESEKELLDDVCGTESLFGSIGSLV